MANLPVKGEGRKPLFSKVTRTHTEINSSQAIVAELKRMNEVMMNILQNQQRIEVYVGLLFYK